MLDLRVVHPRHYLQKAKLANIGLVDMLKMIGPLTWDAFARKARRLVTSHE